MSNPLAAHSLRRHLLAAWLALWCSFGVWSEAVAASPNILLILVDDLKPALGCYGDPVAHTPHVDALAARGLRFELAYCNQAVCAPSRFSLLLGSHATSTGLYGLGSQLRQLVPDAVTLPQFFARHGYRTESLGKVFHIGHGNAGDAASWNVPHFADYVIEYADPASKPGGGLTREEAYFTNQRLSEIGKLPRGAAFESPDAADDAYADGRVAAETVRRLQQARERRRSGGTPFLIAAGFARPHLPFCAPRRYWDMYDPAQLPASSATSPPQDAPAIAGKTNGELANYSPVPESGVVDGDLQRQLTHGYYASVSFVDAQIGKVLSALDELRLAEETIVVLWGDHGFHLGDHGYWTKHTNYEQANRIPLIIAAPGVTAGGTATRQLAESVDVFPTLAELAGLPAPTGPQPIDGRSLAPVLRDPAARVRDHAYHAYPKSSLGRAIRTERHRLVEWRRPGAPPESAELELYDYESDPDETRNVAATQPEVVQRLRTILAAYPEPVDPNRRATPQPAAAPAVAWTDQPGRWTAQRANAWYDAQRWPVGANYLPATAINQLEMWQADTFDPQTIDRELGWAAGIGMNSMRVFLHDLAWQQDPEGFIRRVDQYLEIADRHGISTLLVLFDGVWHPHPKSGLQPQPRPGLHNSGWVQSPGRDILADSAKQDALQPYVHAVLSRYKDDARVIGWDLFNEPDNGNDNSYGSRGTGEELSKPDKAARAEELLRKTFAWARDVNPSQPLTCGVWVGNYLTEPTSLQRFALEASDVISFHTYDNPEKAEALTAGLLVLGRPVFCTEYLARGNKSTLETVLPIFHRHKVAAYNWGLVDGKSQTKFPWDSWQQPYTREPDPWHHDLFHTDGRPYRPAELDFIRSLVNVPPTQQSRAPELRPIRPREELRAGLAAHDRPLFVKQGWIRDPYIVLGPDDSYYLTGTTPLPGDPREQRDPYNTGLGDLSLVGWKLQAWRSRDLLEWESLGTPFTLQDGVWATANPEAFRRVPQSDWRLWAPELHWVGERWALVHTSPAPVRGANLALSAGRDVAGPWSHPFGVAIERRHDPSLFQNDDGTWWLVWGATTIAPLKPDFTGFSAAPTEIGPSGDTKAMGHEGCLLHKIGGKYVLFGTGWSTAQMRRGSYNLYYAVADTITGPYSERRFVGRFLGHGTPFRDRDGRWWCTAFYNGNIPPLSPDGIETRDLSRDAQTINEQGLTLVPLSVTTDAQGEPVIRAIPSAYGTPGPDERQKF